MSSTPWQLEKYHAHLSLGDLSGTVNLMAPASGLQLRWHREVFASLAVELPSVAESHAASVLDFWPRGGDLIATYAQNEGHATRGQLYWRAHKCSQNGQQHPAIDLIASVQTSLLDSDPALKAHSRVPAGEVMRLIALNADRAQSIEWSEVEQRFLPGPGKIPCFIFRLPDGQSSYVEMVHPADFNESVLRRLPNGESELSHRLFAGRLEKGVILRSRIRAIFVPRESDVALASGYYSDFAAAEPVLTV